MDLRIMVHFFIWAFLSNVLLAQGLGIHGGIARGSRTNVNHLDPAQKLAEMIGLARYVGVWYGGHGIDQYYRVGMVWERQQWEQPYRGTSQISIRFHG